MKVGLYFGTYNPIHIGHLAIAGYMLEYSEIDQLWFVVTPQNPFKERSSLLPDYQRLDLVYRAVEKHENMRVSDIEFGLEKPSYTANTLAHLKEKHPDHEFYLIMGADNLATFHKWRNYEFILENYKILVYPRLAQINQPLMEHKNIQQIDAPIMQIASTFIRKAIKEGKDVSYFLPPEVAAYIDETNFYR